MDVSYSRTDTALLLIDPYNDFLSKGGKLHGLAKQVFDATGTLDNLRRVVAAARAAGIRVFFTPHHRARPSDFSLWKNASPYLLGGDRMQVFAEGSWGAEWHPDFVPQEGDMVAKEHWHSSGFAHTDLDLLLRRHGIEKVILVGLLANTCVESTGKFAAELGYHVTLVVDATAAFTREAMDAAHKINGPTYAHAIVATANLVQALAAPAVLEP